MWTTKTNRYLLTALIMRFTLLLAYKGRGRGEREWGFFSLVIAPARESHTRLFWGLQLQMPPCAHKHQLEH